MNRQACGSTLWEVLEAIVVGLTRSFTPAVSRGAATPMNWSRGSCPSTGLFRELILGALLARFWTEYDQNCLALIRCRFWALLGSKAARKGTKSGVHVALVHIRPVCSQKRNILG